MQQQEFTDALKKAFSENKADFRELDEQIRRTQETARARLADNGWEPDPEGIPCLVCSCPDFVAGGHQGTCRRGGCGHSFGSHDLPQ